MRLHQVIRSPQLHKISHLVLSMVPTILIVGATGNTGRSVVETLPKLLQGTSLSSHRILALTRSRNSAPAQKLAQIPGVEVAEKNWTDIDDQWLREHEVERLFIASHNNVSHFAEKSQFHYFALQASVKYAVRISTTAYSVRPVSLSRCLLSCFGDES
jgi:uncharacterized protein YbjT (DUF2867 family)